MMEPFGEEVFQYSLFLVLANRIFTFTVATIVLLVRFLLAFDRPDTTYKKAVS